MRRREDRIARPARVRMRRRKPWVLCRRRLFGWNVRLLNVFTPLEGWDYSPVTGSRRASLVASWGQLAPLAHDGTRRIEAVMDMRHRSTPVQTCQRYAVRADRVNSTAGPPPGAPHPRVSVRHADAWGQLVMYLWTTC